MRKEKGIDTSSYPSFYPNAKKVPAAMLQVHIHSDTTYRTDSHLRLHLGRDLDLTLLSVLVGQTIPPTHTSGVSPGPASLLYADVFEHKVPSSLWHRLLGLDLLSPLVPYSSCLISVGPYPKRATIPSPCSVSARQAPMQRKRKDPCSCTYDDDITAQQCAGAMMYEWWGTCGGFRPVRAMEHRAVDTP